MSPTLCRLCRCSEHELWVSGASIKSPEPGLGCQEMCGMVGIPVGSTWSGESMKVKVKLNRDPQEIWDAKIRERSQATRKLSPRERRGHVEDTLSGGPAQTLGELHHTTMWLVWDGAAGFNVYPACFQSYPIWLLLGSLLCIAFEMVMFTPALSHCCISM